MAKPKFERTKPHVNVGTIFIVFIVFSVLSCLNSFADDKIFDFDGITSDKAALLEKIDFLKNFQPSDEPNGIMERKFFRITESGQEVEVLPEEINDGKAYYKFKPNDKFYSKYRCSTPQRDYTWSVCEYYKFYPNYGGHNHDGNIPPYTWNNQPLSNPVCRYNLPVNTDSYIYFKAPEFATRAEHRIQYSGACSGTYFDIIDIKIDGLVLLPPAWQDSLHGGVTYYNLINNPPYSTYHPINHFGKSQTLELLKQIAWQYYREFPRSEVLNINDISLRWGGKFDINADWTGQDHKYHRYGRQTDVRLWSIPVENRERFKQICCNRGVEVELHSKDHKPLEVFDFYMEGVDFTLPPWNSFSEEELDMRVPHYHLVFPKYDTEINDPPDQTPQGCPPSR